MDPARVVVTGPMNPRVLDALRQRFDVAAYPNATEAARLEASSPGAKARAVASGSSHGKIDAALFNALPSLEIVAHFGVGYETVDAVEAARRGIVVTNTPGVLDADVADLALGLMIATVRQFARAERFVRSGAWTKAKFPLGPSLRNRKVGILGLGRIGKAVAERCRALGLSVAYHGRQPQTDVPFAYFASPVDMAEAVDILVVTAPGGEATHHIVNEGVLAALGSQGVLINVARGSLVDEQALASALQQGTIFAAGLDVYENEPHVSDALLALDNVVLLPHIGSASVETRNAMSDLLTGNIVSWLDGNGALTPVPECFAIPI